MDIRESSNRSAGESARHPWELARLRVVSSLIRPLVASNKPIKVLDIGCGDVFFVSELSSLYPQAEFFAVDTAFTPDLIANLKQQTAGKKIYLFNSLDDAEKQLTGPADLVFLLDVIEHIEDDKGFLQSLLKRKSVLKDTKVVISVPAFQSLFCSHDNFLGHFRRYTNGSLKKVIRESGYEALDWGYFFCSLLPPRTLQVLKEKYLNRGAVKETTGLVEWKAGPMATNALEFILLMDFRFTNFVKRLTGLRVAGLSNYIICKKSAS